MKKEDLQLMSVEQLRAVLDNIGVEYHHKSGPSKLIDAILSAQVPVVEVPRKGAAPTIEELADQASHTATQELKPIKQVRQVEYPTVEQVADAIAPFIQRGLEVIQLDDDGFHFRRGHKEDSGNLNQPLRRIVDMASRLV
jgi:hypothetical protein